MAARPGQTRCHDHPVEANTAHEPGCDPTGGRMPGMGVWALSRELVSTSASTSWALLNRPDLRAVQDAFRRWIGAASLVVPAERGGAVFLSAESTLGVSQALVRWDPQGWAERELADRAEVGFPPAVHMIAVDGAAESLAEIADELRVPDEVELLGPVDLPPGSELPGQDSIDDPERLLLRVPPALLDRTAAELRAMIVVRSGRRSAHPVRVRLDPLHIG